MLPIDFDAHFSDHLNAAELCELLCRYCQENIPVPDPLLNRLAEMEDEAPLIALTLDETKPLVARLHAIELLRQLGSVTPMVDFLRWQVERTQEEDLLDSALESLRSMGEQARIPAKVAFLAAGQEGKEALLDVLCGFPGDDEVFSFALSCFTSQKDKRALYAGYLAKLDDDRALEALLDAADSEDTPYIDFIEIRSAIERLGSEAPIRDFSKDPTYMAVQRLQ